MNPELNVTFTHKYENEDFALLLEVIAGEIRQGSSSGSAPEYAWKLLPVQAGLP